MEVVVGDAPAHPLEIERSVDLGKFLVLRGSGPRPVRFGSVELKPVPVVLMPRRCKDRSRFVVPDVPSRMDSANDERPLHGDDGEQRNDRYRRPDPSSAGCPLAAVFIDHVDPGVLSIRPGNHTSPDSKVRRHPLLRLLLVE